jgi:hypothetical protein
MRSAATAVPQEAADQEAQVVHAWRAARLASLGLTEQVAEAVADRVDWHEVARLVRAGCPASLAVAIVE